MQSKHMYEFQGANTRALKLEAKYMSYNPSQCFFGKVPTERMNDG